MTVLHDHNAEIADAQEKSEGKSGGKIKILLVCGLSVLLIVGLYFLFSNLQSSKQGETKMPSTTPTLFDTINDGISIGEYSFSSETTAGEVLDHLTCSSWGIDGQEKQDVNDIKAMQVESGTVIFLRGNDDFSEILLNIQNQDVASKSLADCKISGIMISSISDEGAVPTDCIGSQISYYGVKLGNDLDRLIDQFGEPENIGSNNLNTGNDENTDKLPTVTSVFNNIGNNGSLTVGSYEDNNIIYHIDLNMGAKDADKIETSKSEATTDKVASLRKIARTLPKSSTMPGDGSIVLDGFELTLGKTTVANLTEDGKFSIDYSDAAPIELDDELLYDEQEFNISSANEKRAVVTVTPLRSSGDTIEAIYGEGLITSLNLALGDPAPEVSMGDVVFSMGDDFEPVLNSLGRPTLRTGNLYRYDWSVEKADEDGNASLTLLITTDFDGKISEVLFN